MKLPTKAEFDSLVERYTERWALCTCRSATFIQCLKKFGIIPTITVISPTGKSITINASDIYAARMRFFVGLDTSLDLGCLTAIGDKLVDLYLDWLLNKYTNRYRYITSDTHRKWLRKVIILVVARYLMEHKYALYIREGHQTFADAWVCSEMCRLQLLNNLTSELARLVHHIIDNPEQQQSLIDRFHKDLDIRMRGHLFITTDQLPPLPEGVILPFALLSQSQEMYEE